MKRVAWLLLLAAGCGNSPADRVWYGSKSILRNASKVEAYRIDAPEPGPGKETDWWKWPMKSGPIVVDSATAKSLADYFLDDASYDQGPPRACLPRPGIKMRYIDGEKVLSFLICLDCLSVYVRHPDGDKKGAELDPKVRGLNAIMKKIFPKDADIQSFGD